MTGTDSGGHATAAATSTATVTATAAPAVTLVKTATVAPAADQANVKVGDVVTYSFKVTNSGNTTIASVALTDPSDSASPVACAGGLAPGASITCSGTTTHTITQADVDAGTRSDTASATGTDTKGNTSPPATSTAVVASTQSPALSVTKTAAVAPTADQSNVKVGDVVTYSFKITNTGNTTLTSLNVTDPSDSATAVACAVPVGGLLIGASVTCTGTTTHTITQADVDAGSRSDTATATGTDAVGNTSPPATSTATVTAVPAPAISLTKTATVSPAAHQLNLQVGDLITYSFVVKNTGNTTIASIDVEDPQDSPTPVACPVPVGGLAVGNSISCVGTTTHTVNQADVDAGSRSDTATATGTDTHDHQAAAVSATATAPSVPGPGVTLVKTATVAPAADQTNVKLGDVVTYSFKITNVGNTTLTSLTIADPSDSASPVTCAPPAGGLSPGVAIMCAGTTAHTITQADIDAGSRSDTATATGTDTGANTSPRASSTATVHSAAAPALTLVKTATVAPTADQTNVKVGDVVTYSFTVTNTGNTTLATLVVSDPSDSSSPVTCPVPVGGLAPGGSVICTGTTTYIVTQADVDAGSRTDTASASGTDSGGNVTASATSSATVSSTAGPAITLLKTATVSPAADQSNVKVGDVVTYSFKVTNTGSTTIASVHLTDPSDSASPVACAIAGGLAPGASIACAGTTSHTITQADVDAGSRSDTASVTGTDTVGHATAPAPSTATVTSTPAPALTLVKTATVAPAADQTNVKVGDVVTYSFTITNSGNTTLASLNLTDPSDSASPVACAGGLAPGACMTCSGTTTHTITQADVDAGSRSDTASATGTDTKGNPTAPATSTATVTSTPEPGADAGEDRDRGPGRRPDQRQGRGRRHLLVHDHQQRQHHARVAEPDRPVGLRVAGRVRGRSRSRREHDLQRDDDAHHHPGRRRRRQPQRHRVGHGHRYEGQPDGLTRRATSALRRPRWQRSRQPRRRR